MDRVLNDFKKDYRARFCHGGRNKIDVQQGQNVLELIQDCFESCGSDLTISSPSAGHCLSPVARNEKRTSTQSQGAKAGKNSVKRACSSAEPLPISPLKPVSSRGRSHETCLKPAIFDYVADSEKTKSPVSKGKTNNTLKDVDALCRSPTVSLDSEDDHRSVGSPILVEEAKISAVHTLHFDDQNNPAAVKSHMDIEKLEGPQTGRDEQVAVQTDHTATSVQKDESVAKGTLGKRCSSSLLLLSAPPVKDQDTEIEYECEFLIDESDESFNSWLSIPHKKKKSKKDDSAAPVSKSQPPRKKNTESTRGKNRKTQAEALTKRKMDDLDVGVHDCKGTLELNAVSNSEGKDRRSKRQSSIQMRKTKKGALRQGSPNKEKDISWKPEAEELMLSWSGLETKASDVEQCKTRVIPSMDLSMHLTGHQQEPAVSPNKNRKSSKCPQSSSKASQPLVHKRQTSKQKPPKGKVAKRLAESPEKQLKKSGEKGSNKKSQLQNEEISDSQLGEEGVEREPVELNEVHQKFQTSVIQKLDKSEKSKNVLDTLESLGGANNRTPEKAQQHRVHRVKNTGKKQSSATSSRKIPKKINLRTSKGVWSNPKDTECQADSDSSTVQDTARKRQKLSDVKMSKRQCNMQHGLEDYFPVEKVTGRESGPVLGYCDKPVSGSEEGNVSSDSSEDLNYQLRYLLLDNTARHKIVMPSNTPNVRRTKRIRLRPLEYWRGERVNYVMRPSGELVISGIACPKPEPHRDIKQRKDGHRKKRDETRHEIPIDFYHSLGDASKPSVVLDPKTNREILLACINTENMDSFFNDESVEIYKNLNTSAFAIGRLVLKPLKEKGHQFVYMDTLAFYVIRGKIILTLHETSYYLTTGDYFYVPEGNGYNLRNLLNEESVLLYTQLKKDP